MSSSVLEIVELPDGEIVLKRVGGQEEPLLNIRFSEESLGYMPQVRLEVAKAMIQAGIQAFAELTEQATAEDPEPSAMPASQVLH